MRHYGYLFEHNITSIFSEKKVEAIFEIAMSKQWWHQDFIQNKGFRVAFTSNQDRHASIRREMSTTNLCQLSLPLELLLPPALGTLDGVSLTPERFWSNPDSIIACDACLTSWRRGLVSGEIFPYCIPTVHSGIRYAHKRPGDVNPDRVSDVFQT